MSGLLVHEAFLASAARRRAKPAVVFEGRDVTYGELADDVRRLSGALQDGLGLEAGTRVGVLLPNRPEFYVAVLAVAHAGLVSVPVPVAATARELEHFVADSGMRSVLVDDAVAERLGECLDGLARGGLAVHQWDRGRPGSPSVRELMAGGSSAAAAAPVPDDAPFFFGYTSGTTGRPKAAVVSHRARTALTLLLGQEYGCYAASDTALVTTPLYHSAGLTRGLTPVMTGGTVLLHRRFDPEAVVAALAEPPVTAAFMVPTMFAAIFELGDDVAGRVGSRPLTILSNASALPEHLKQKILGTWPGVRLFEIYGSTEAGTVSSLRPEDQRRKARCVGQPLALTETTVVGPDGAELPAGEVGELLTRSPFVFDGYFGNEAATRSAVRDGFVTAGDLARKDEEGYLYIVGRMSEVIISGGVNVYPREVEEVIAAHPAVRDVAVVGVDDGYWGEQVRAFVVAADGRGVDAGALEAHCRELLAPQKIPRSFVVVEELPRTASGKVAKHRLTRSTPGRGA